VVGEGRTGSRGQLIAYKIRHVNLHAAIYLATCRFCDDRLICPTIEYVDTCICYRFGYDLIGYDLKLL